MAAIVALLVIGCGATAPPPHVVQNVPAPVAAPKPKPKPAPVATGAAPSLALYAGGWHGEDDDHWGYDLDIEPDGTFSQVVHQGAGGTDCQQTGTIVASADTLVRTFRTDECNTEYDGKAVTDVVVTYDGPHLVLRMESDYLIRYSRAP